MNLILINGQAGTGKTTVAKALLNILDNTAFVDTDALTMVNPLNPFVFKGQLGNLAIKNALSLIQNFIDSGYKNIIISGLIKNQVQLEKCQSSIGENTDLLFVWLRASKEKRIERKQGRGRDNADNPEHFEFIDSLIPDVQKFELKKGKYLDIDTTLKTIPEIIAEIKTKI